jgi:hypothetical protein
MTCTLARKRKNYHLERIGSGFCFSMQPKVHLAFARRAFGIFNCNCLRLWKLIFTILAGLGKHLRTPARIAPCCYQSCSVARKLSFPDFTLDHGQPSLSSIQHVTCGEPINSRKSFCRCSIVLSHHDEFEHDSDMGSPIPAFRLAI